MLNVDTLFKIGRRMGRLRMLKDFGRFRTLRDGMMTERSRSLRKNADSVVNVPEITDKKGVNKKAKAFSVEPKMASHFLRSERGWHGGPSGRKN